MRALPETATEAPAPGTVPAKPFLDAGTGCAGVARRRVPAGAKGGPRPAQILRRLALLAGALPALAVPMAAAQEKAVVPYTIVDGRSIPEPLTAAPGDPERGRALFLDALRTGCASCHSAPGAARVPAGGYGTGGSAGSADPADAGVDADAAPAREKVALDGVGTRLSEGEIRLWLVAPQAIAPGVAMPGYYLAGQRKGAHDPLHNGPRLTAAEIEDLVAFLARIDRAE